jgi:hypothetical protein
MYHLFSLDNAQAKRNYLAVCGVGLLLFMHYPAIIWLTYKIATLHIDVNTGCPIGMKECDVVAICYENHTAACYVIGIILTPVCISIELAIVGATCYALGSCINLYTVYHGGQVYA